ncbi:MAG: protein kinase [Deltaproteobacteria bacterium]|nr:protein kinase [Deltaproteobacteria bacterium]
MLALPVGTHQLHFEVRGKTFTREVPTPQLRIYQFAINLGRELRLIDAGFDMENQAVSSAARVDNSELELEPVASHAATQLSASADDLQRNPEAMRLFSQEAKALAQLNHTNIVAVYDQVTVDTKAYLIMEYVDGSTLETLLAARKTFPWRDAVDIADQLCAGLAYVHARRVIHRDIKPANIFIARDGTVKLGDFGLARVVRELTIRKTEIRGTPLYMAPEQILGSDIDHRVDLYAVGCTLFELVTGRPPFIDGDILYHQLHGTAPRPRRRRSARICRPSSTRSSSRCSRSPPTIAPAPRTRSAPRSAGSRRCKKPGTRAGWRCPTPVSLLRMVAAVFVVGATAGGARADLLRSTLTQPLFEVSHTVDIRLEDGVAVYKVKRQFANPGKVADEAGLEIDLPPGGAATGLRIRAKERWYDGVLMEREKAAALYKELTGFGAYAPKDPALLQWMWADKLYLQVFPVMPGEVSTVEYTITVPTRYSGGRYWIAYPRIDVAATQGSDAGSLGLATPIITVRPAWGNAVLPIAIDGKRVAPDTAVVLSVPVRQAWEAAVAAEGTASYVASTIEVPASSHTTKLFTTAMVTLDIRHTYKSDVKVELLAPSGKAVTLFDRKGGGDNNITGTFPVTLPEPTKGAGTWRLVVSDHVGLDNGSIDKWELTLDTTKLAATDTPVFIPDAPENASDAGLAAISVAAPPIAMLATRLGKVVASDKHAFTRLEIDVASQLVPLPKRAQVVFAVDASFSGTPEMIEAQLAIIRTYTSHVPDAEVEIIAYRRVAKRVFGRFVPVKELAKAIDDARRAGAFELGNGSALDAAAQLAITTLASRKGPRRLVITTDRLVRSRLTPQLALATLAKLPKDVVVHTVAPILDHSDRVTLTREDADPLAPLATRHHGIFVDLGGMPSKTDKDLAPIVLELVRPTRIEKLAVSDGIKLDTDVLREGDGIRFFKGARTAPGRVVLTGVLWSDPIRREVSANDAFSRSAAASVFGEDEYHALSEAEQMTVAMMGRAVSPVTSYVAFEPGTRPSTIGLLGHGSGTGSGYGVGGGHGGRYGTSAPPDLRTLIDVKSCVALHKPAGTWRVTLAVETTRTEIVDVQVTAGAGPLASCFAETTWSVALPQSFVAQRQTITVELGN